MHFELYYITFIAKKNLHLGYQQNFHCFLTLEIFLNLHGNKYLHMHWDFYTDSCDRIDTIILSSCVAYKKFSILIVFLFSKLTLTFSKSLLLLTKFYISKSILAPKFSDDLDFRFKFLEYYMPGTESRLPKSLVWFTQSKS